MDAIVAGKVEKAEGSKTFKAVVTYDVSTSTSQVKKYDCPAECFAVRLVSKDSDTESTTFEFRKFGTETSFALGTIIFYKRSGQYYGKYSCNCWFNQTSQQFTFNSSPSQIGDFISVIEIGTLE